ncbi:hypothetical protein GCM10027048_09320 [Hymenobacter coalescens]
MKKLLYALLALGMAACGKKDTETLSPNQLMTNDFESIEGWIDNMNVPSLSKDKAHSGRYALKVGPESEYSLGYNVLLGKLSPSKLKKVKVKGWVYMPNGKAQAMLVTQLTDPVNPGGQPILWDGLDLAKSVKNYNKWVEVEKVVTLPENANYAHKFTIYLWRTNPSEVVYFDDISVEKAD